MKRIKWKKWFYYLFCVALFPLTIVFFPRNKRIGVTRYNIVDETLPSAFDGFKILQISDMHNSKYCKERAPRILREERPDVIVVTGDLIDANRTDLTPATHLMESAVKIAPTYYVTGNHEAKSEEAEELFRRLEKIGVHVLDDRLTELERAGQKITLLGLKEYRFTMEGQPKAEIYADVQKRLRRLVKNSSGYRILLSHRPELFELYIADDINLTFTGHAHGGQFRLPMGILSPNQGLFPKYTCGIYKKGNKSMVVSRGIGNSAFPFRINNDPEIVCVTLTKKEK